MTVYYDKSNKSFEIEILFNLETCNPFFNELSQVVVSNQMGDFICILQLKGLNTDCVDQVKLTLYKAYCIYPHNKPILIIKFHHWICWKSRIA